MILFEGNYGRVVSVEDAGVQAQLGIVAIMSGNDVSLDINYTTMASIITRIAVAQSVNVQFLHTLGANVYVYVFGDRMGDITLSGMSFAGVDCTGQSIGRTPITDRHGLEILLEWYKNNRLSTRKSPVRVIVGSSTPIDGFVVTYNSDIVDPQTGLSQWTVGLKTLPE